MFTIMNEDRSIYVYTYSSRTFGFTTMRRSVSFYRMLRTPETYTGNYRICKIRLFVFDVRSIIGTFPFSPDVGFNNVYRRRILYAFGSPQFSRQFITLTYIGRLS